MIKQGSHLNCLSILQSFLISVADWLFFIARLLDSYFQRTRSFSQGEILKMDESDSEYDGSSGSDEEAEGIFMNFEVAEARAKH